MSEIITVEFDLAKDVFQAHGADALVLSARWRYCARSCGEIRCWLSSGNCDLASW